MPVHRRNAAHELASGSGLTPQLLHDLADAQLAPVVVTAPSQEARSGSCVGDASWIWPESLYPKKPSERTVSFAALAPFPVLGMEVRRYLLAQMLFPLTRYLDLPGLRKRALYMSKLCAQIGMTAGDRRLGDVEESVFASAFAAVTDDLGPQTRLTVGGYVAELNAHGARGAISGFFEQVPAAIIESLANQRVGALPHRPETHQDDDFRQWQPLPDEYVAAAGRIWVYYLREVLPNLDRVLVGWRDLKTTVHGRQRVWSGRTGALSNSTLKRMRSNAWVKKLAAFRWTGSDGRPLEQLPFQAPVLFPPREFRDLTRLIALVQGSLLQALLLLTGGRVSEIEALRPGCLWLEGGVSSDDVPILLGRTFKLSGLTHGDERDWPVPRAVADAIRLQQRVGDHIVGNRQSLWLSMSQPSRYFGGRIFPYYHVSEFADDHGLTHHLNGTPAHPHKFRKTIARLAVLSLTGAPLILRDIFGHSDLEATLQYILGNPDIRAEMAETAREVGLEQAEAVALGLHDAGGKGAETLRSARDTFFDRLKVPANERQQRRRLEEFASAVLADGGIEIKMIYPGIVCTKPAAARGACSKDEIKPSACEATCQHYLAMPERRTATRDTIEWLIGQLADPAVLGNPLLAGWFRAQLHDQVRVFSDLHDVYRGDQRCRLALGEGQNAPR